MSNKPIIGFTTGDINGIGLEVVLKTLVDNRIHELCTPLIYGSQKVVSFHRKALNIQQFNYNMIDSLDKLQPNTINIFNCWQEDVNVQFGAANETGGKYALRSLEVAVYDWCAGNIDGIVTAPINKHTIQGPNFKFTGVTEYLTQKTNTPESLMMLVSDDLRVGLVTNHLPIAEVAPRIKQEAVLRKMEILNRTLVKDFGIDKPKIAVLSLNPHAGDKGLIGEEEIKEIIPALKSGEQKGILCFGPYPADGFFGSGQHQKFDGILAMYHDQGLTPFKTISFHSGVDYTAGLPFVRTSPDHGTGFDIAGRNLASEDSLRSALFLCIDIINYRRGHEERTANPVKRHEMKTERH